MIWESNNSGQSLIEVIVGVGVVLVLISGLVVGTTSSLKTSRLVIAKTEAGKYAQEGIELARGLRDLSWADFQAKTGSWCIDGSGNWTQTSVPCGININNKYARQIDLVWNALDERMEAKVTVRWHEVDRDLETNLETYFTNWR